MEKRGIVFDEKGNAKIEVFMPQDIGAQWEHVSLDGILGEKLGLFVLNAGELNPRATRLVRLLRFEFGYSTAGDGARGKCILYNDARDVTPQDWDFIKTWMKIKELRGERANAMHKKVQETLWSERFAELTKKV